MEFIRTTAINKILKIKARKKIIQGGTSAGKTFGIIPILIDKALKVKGLQISIVSESYPHLRRGARKDFINIMKAVQRWDETKWNKTESTYTFYNGSYIEFFSADSEMKSRGARRDILYINECNAISFEIYHQLAIRTNNEIYLDFNPSAEFWVHTEVEPHNDAELIKLTYKDNEALSKSIVDDIESAKEKAKKSDYWKNWWKVYGLGEIGNLEGIVFDNWKQIDNIPPDAKLLGYGLDFGYSVDPTTIVALYVLNGDLYVDEILYQKGMSNKAIADFINANCEKSYDIIGDSAEPKSIAEISTYGCQIYGAKKGRDSISFSIQLLLNYKMHITKNSTYLIKELRGYLWDKKHNGSKPKPLSHLPDHSIDALRYISTDKLEPTTEANYSFA